MTDGGEGIGNFSDRDRSFSFKKVYQYTLGGVFIRDWESIASVDLGLKCNYNIPTAIKKGGTLANSIWSYNKEVSMKPRIKNQMIITYKNIEQLDKNTMCVINKFENGREIENTLNLIKGSKSKIYACINGKAKTAFGNKWRIKT